MEGSGIVFSGGIQKKWDDNMKNLGWKNVSDNKPVKKCSKGIYGFFKLMHRTASGMISLKMGKDFPLFDGIEAKKIFE